MLLGDDDLIILLVEDNVEETIEMSNAIESVEEMELIGVTNSSSQALKYVKDYLPDVVILDLELLNGSGSGLSFLMELQNECLPKIPYIIVTTNNISKFAVDSSHNYGADFIFSKHQEDYSAQTVVDFIKTINPLITKKNNIKNYTSPQLLRDSQKRLTKRIMYELDIIGISPKSIGYSYLVDAIKIMIDGKTTYISAAVAKKYGKTDSSVERAMQNAINRAWRYNDISTLYEHYTATIYSE